MDASSRSMQISQAIAEVFNCTAVLSSPEYVERALAQVSWPAFLKSYRESLRIALEALDQPNPTMPMVMLEAVMRLRRFEPLLLADPIDWPLVHDRAREIVAPLMRPPAS